MKTFLPCLVALLIGVNIASALTDADIQKARTTAQQRCDAFFRKQAGHPLVNAPIKKDWEHRGDFTRLYNQNIILFATRAFYLNEQNAEANKALAEMCQYHLDRPQTLLEIHSFPGVIRPLVKLVLLYGSDGTSAKGLLSKESEQIILKTLWTWASAKSEIADADVKDSQTWNIVDSENHHINHFASCWSVSLLLARQPEYRDQKFADGHTPREHHEAWTAYFSEYLRQRACKGMMIEMDSPSYSSLALSAAYWIYDLADDVRLKQRASDYMTLWWTLWAEQQINGVCGGAKARCYPASARRGDDFIRRMAWYVLDEGTPDFQNFAVIPFVTSTWHMPDLVFDLVLDTGGRGVYEVNQRRPGLLKGPEVKRDFIMRPDFGGILRYTYCTPDYIMGSMEFEARPKSDWAAISSQNRWFGAIFRGATDARIYPYCDSPHSAYNAQWAVQHKGSMIFQKLKTSTDTEGLNVWFSKEGISAPEKIGPWYFANADGAWAAVRVVSGDATFAPDSPDENANPRPKRAPKSDDDDSNDAATSGKPGDGRTLKCSDEYSPVIVEVARKTDFPTVEAFRKAVLALPVQTDKNKLAYTGLSGSHLTLYTDQTHLPEVDGRTVDLAPPKVYDSPFVQSAWNSGVIDIRKDARKLTLNFNESARP